MVFVVGLWNTMIEKENFGSISSKQFSIGDIVEWTKWNPENETWDLNYGILIKIENKIRSNRIISISTVRPINQPQTEVELFTLSLKPVEKASINKPE
jgi:hypothetical protein